MFANELTDVLRTFSKKEMTMFGKFLNSPYFNNRKRMTEFYLILKKFHPAYDNEKLNKEYVKARLFKNKNVSDTTFRGVTHKFLNLTYEFLNINSLKKEDMLANVNYMDELIKKGLYSVFEKQASRKLQKLSLFKKKDALDYKYLFELNTQSFMINLLTKKVLKNPFAVAEAEKLNSGISSFLRYFILTSFAHINNLLVFSHTYDLSDFEKSAYKFLKIFDFNVIISYLNEFSKENSRDIEVYYHCLNAKTHFDEENYYKIFRDSLLKYSKHFTDFSNKYFFAEIVSYLTYKINLGVKSSLNFLEENLKLHIFFIEKRYSKSGAVNYLTLDLYRNVLFCCIGLKKISFMESFIKKFLKKLYPEKIETVKIYSYALLNFEKGLYAESLKSANKIHEDELVLKLDMKNLKTKIYYEMQQWEDALSILDSYRHFLKNNDLVNINRRMRHNNFIEYMRMMINHRTAAKELDVELLLNDEEKLLKTINSEWIIDKLKELKKNGARKVKHFA